MCDLDQMALKFIRFISGTEKHGLELSDCAALRDVLASIGRFGDIELLRETARMAAEMEGLQVMVNKTVVSDGPDYIVNPAFSKELKEMHNRMSEIETQI